LALKINGNHGAQKEILKFFKEVHHFNKNSKFRSDVKNDLIGHPESDKKIQL